MKNKRLLASFVIFLAIIFLPYWIYAPLLFLAIVYFPFFWEGLLLGFLVDALYGRLGMDYYLILKSFSFWSLVLLVILMPLRRMIRSYA